VPAFHYSPVQFNDIDMRRWKEYDEIITDSLWILGRRDNSGAHTPEYHGNFVPQIPRQAMLRFTRRGEWVLDPFAGLGTTLIEARRLGRNAVGVELSEEIAEKARSFVSEEPGETVAEILVGDSTRPETFEAIREIMDTFHLVILHPPYWNIIRFTERREDLSNAPTLDAFLSAFSRTVGLVRPLLAARRYLVLVIGDAYRKGEWIPLGFYTMKAIMDAGFRLKSIVVKDIQENRGKRGQYSLWRYRALRGGYYVFKHEYVMFFQKVGR